MADSFFDRLFRCVHQDPNNCVGCTYMFITRLNFQIRKKKAKVQRILNIAQLTNKSGYYFF